MPIYEGNPGVELERISSIANGDPANVSRLTLGVHTGTHVDAPLHFIDLLRHGIDLDSQP